MSHLANFDDQDASQFIVSPSTYLKLTQRPTNAFTNFIADIGNYLGFANHIPTQFSTSHPITTNLVTRTAIMPTTGSQKEDVPKKVPFKDMTLEEKLRYIEAKLKYNTEKIVIAQRARDRYIQRDDSRKLTMAEDLIETCLDQIITLKYKQSKLTTSGSQKKPEKGDQVGAESDALKLKERQTNVENGTKNGTKDDSLEVKEDYFKIDLMSSGIGGAANGVTSAAERLARARAPAGCDRRVEEVVEALKDAMLDDDLVIIEHGDVDDEEWEMIYAEIEVIEGLED